MLVADNKKTKVQQRVIVFAKYLSEPEADLKASDSSKHSHMVFLKIIPEKEGCEAPSCIKAKE